MAILVTGGAGYIGSHAALRLLRDGHRVVILDNLYRGHAEAVEAVRAAAAKEGRGLEQNLRFVRGSIDDEALVAATLRDNAVDTVMHFAALAYVGESVHQPLAYYGVNTAGGTALLRAIARAGEHGAGVQRFVFSSTCATYGEPGPGEVPIKETLKQNPINPYGASKLFFERVLADFSAAQNAAGKAFSVAMLRYFNVAGCDRSGLLGEQHDPETHLIPVILQALLGVRADGKNMLTVFGTDYPTPDGSCIRDYVHVDDLVDAHVRAIGVLRPAEIRRYNVGIGRGHSVKEVIAAAEKVTGMKVPVTFGPRRAGDPATLFADSTAIRTELGWSPRYTNLEDTIATAWAWFKANPHGYAKR